MIFNINNLVDKLLETVKFVKEIIGKIVKYFREDMWKTNSGGNATSFDGNNEHQLTTMTLIHDKPETMPTFNPKIHRRPTNEFEYGIYPNNDMVIVDIENGMTRYVTSSVDDSDDDYEFVSDKDL